MASWYEKTLIPWGDVREDDRLHLGDASAPAGSRDRTLARADLRRIANAQVVAQAAHGLAALDPIRHDGTTWVRSTADTAANSVVAGLVVAVPDVDTFIIQSGADVIDQAGLTAGAVHYLQDLGGIGTTPGTVEVPVLLATSASAGVLLRVGGGIPYDLALGFVGTPAASALDWLLAGRGITIASADPGSAYARTLPADGDWTATIQKNGTSVGAVTISTLGAVTWSVAADIVLAAGDRLELVAPDPADSAAADVQVVLRGSA